MQPCSPLKAAGREALKDVVSHFNAMETSIFQRQSTGSTGWNATQAYMIRISCQVYTEEIAQCLSFNLYFTSFLNAPIPQRCVFSCALSYIYI